MSSISAGLGFYTCQNGCKSVLWVAKSDCNKYFCGSSFFSEKEALLCFLKEDFLLFFLFVCFLISMFLQIMYKLFDSMKAFLAVRVFLQILYV